MNILYGLLVAISALLANTKVQANPTLLAEVSSMNQTANALVQEYIAENAPKTPLLGVTNQFPSSPEIMPPDSSTYVPLLTSSTTTAWIEFNNQTGTVILSPGIYEGQLTWGSTNTVDPGCGILGAGGWAGNFGTSGSKQAGGWNPGTHTITLTCNGNPIASASVIVIDSDP